VIRAIDEDNAADREYAIAAKSWGMVGSLRLLWEARAAGLWASQGLALRTIESGVRGDGNVWGHDSSPNGGTSDLGGEPVTEADYRAYLRRRGNRGQGGMQGVGPLQLTWWGFQDEADKIGGCWVAKFNYRIGFDHFAHLVVANGERLGAAIYNGGPSRPNFAYADKFAAAKDLWHDRLT
jgi:hypothetical protein